MSLQCTEYRDHKTNSLIARVSEHVQGHRAGEIVYLPKVGRVYISSVEPVMVHRVNNNAEQCTAVHVIMVRVDGTA